MAVRAGGKISGVRYAGSSTYAPILPYPIILAVSNDTPANGSALVISGLHFSASGNRVYLTDGTAEATQAITAQSETEITIAVARGPFRYGAALALVVEDDAERGSAGYPLTLTPQAGWDYIDIVTPNSEPALRLTALPDLAGGDQVAYETVGGKVHVRDDASFYLNDASVAAFDCEAWSPGEGWGDIGTQTIIASDIEPQVFNGSHPLADDAVHVFSPAVSNGMVEVFCEGLGGSWGKAYFRVGTGPLAEAAYAGSLCAFTTIPLTGTTGADGMLTLSAQADGSIAIENRTGGTRIVVWQLFGRSL